MKTKERLTAAFNNAIVGVGEFEAAWIAQLPRERLQEQLHDMTSKGVKIGFLLVGQQSAQLIAVDQAGGWVTLEDIQFQTNTRH